MDFRGPLRKYLREFELEWEFCKGWKFRVLYESIFSDLNEEFRQLELDRQSAHEMKQHMKLYARILHDSPHYHTWDTRLKSSIYLYVYIHAYIERRGKKGVIEIKEIFEKIKCKQIIDILSKISLPVG